MANILKTVNDFWKKVTGDKKRWRRMEARAKKLPNDYHFAYDEIKKYMWKLSAGSGMDTIDILDGVLGLFEEGAADSKQVLDITGQDVAAFCDGLLGGAKTYVDNWRKDLNHTVAKKIENKD
ncbi:MAG: DUF1048 domain-containing protein [Patescibacteria group bacterium]|jgi:DNA-binding ferritin-like protein (Dps family)